MKNWICILLGTLTFQLLHSQTSTGEKWWHNKERTLRYHPEGTDIVITNGNRRFTRALYGTNSAFRVEAGDLPEFALYMPGMGGNLKFGLSNNDSSKWLINADRITARYRAGSMVYEIEDEMLGKGKLHLIVLAMGDADGVIIKIQFENVQSSLKLIWAYGGASGKKFSRDGDMGPDPESSFYLKSEYCIDNSYHITGNSFLLKYGTGVVAEWDPYVNKNFASDTVKAIKIGKEQRITGFVPPAMKLQVADAEQQNAPNKLLASTQSKSSIIAGKMAIKNNEHYYFAIQKADSASTLNYSQAQLIFSKAESARKKIADRVKVSTPDKYINTLGSILSVAADAVWENPTFLHGAIGWRMRLNGWRGPYVGDVLSWHDRAKTHFKAYALSQVTSPLTGPLVMDTALHLARSLEKMGTSVFSSGYICRNPNGDFRPHHYNMNLVYIDALFRHFNWTGDIAFAKEMWPVITRHFEWEKRNFDPDGDGLYDAYAAIWASDALQYSGGSVTHSSAYNYKANKEAAIIARLIGEDPTPYEKEAAKILKAINSTLWMPEKGSYAEFKDLLGNKMLHSNAAVWTIYHVVDSDVPDPFQAYQSMKYIDANIPHIPVRAKGIEEGYETISTSKWMPYDWSLNNVATAEVMHTALAYWQSGIAEKGFKLFKSELLSTMYLGGSPGNIGQISFYDAARGEAYRDFADPVAMTARSLVEGLFGILPNAAMGELIIKPGFPAAWNSASIKLPDITMDFKRTGKEDSYTIIPAFAKKMQLKLQLRANGATIQSVLLNGKTINWKNVADAIDIPVIEINAGVQNRYLIKIIWSGNLSSPTADKVHYINGDKLNIQFPGAVVQNVYDPLSILKDIQKGGNKFSGVIDIPIGSYIVFLQLKQNDLSWWEPVEVIVKDVIEISTPAGNQSYDYEFDVFNNTASPIKGRIVVNPGPNASTRELVLQPNKVYTQLNSGDESLIPGTNEIIFEWDGGKRTKTYTRWDTKTPVKNAQQMDMTRYFNDKVTNIFKNKYLSPRPNVATLQLPTQGIGDWTHPIKTANIDDSGFRKLAGERNQFVLPQGVSFATTSDSSQNNILFTSMWDNYPDDYTIPLTGSASHIYMLMAGSTNPMQSRLVNGAVIITYTDNSTDTLLLKNPENWWPIEQDYLEDGYAFTTDATRPLRIHLKTGKIITGHSKDFVEYNGKVIDGGAATVLDMPLNKFKVLKELKLQAIANDVVIGIMAITLIR